jgi:hypothetical protein
MLEEIKLRMYYFSSSYRACLSLSLLVLLIITSTCLPQTAHPQQQNGELFYDTDAYINKKDEINLSNTPGNAIIEQISDHPQISTSEGNVYVVWQDNYLGNYDIFFKRSIDGGASFERANNITGETEVGPHFLRLAASKENVYIVWGGDFNGDIYLTRSTDGGASFANTINLSNNTGYLDDLRIAAAEDNVYVLWNGGQIDDNQVFFKRSTDGGASFANTINLSNNREQYTSIAMYSSDKNLYIASNNAIVGNNLQGDAIYLTRSTDGGASFANTINLSNDGKNSYGYQLTAFGNNLYFIWRNGTGNIFLDDIYEEDDDAVYLARSTDGGASFERTINLSNDTGIIRDVQLALSKNKVYATWESKQEVFLTTFPLLTPTITPTIHGSQDRDQYPTQDFSSPITIDGKVEPGEWMGVPTNKQETNLDENAYGGNSYEVTLASTLDDKNIYIITAVQGKDTNTHKGNGVITHLFDSNGNLHLDTGEDVLMLYRGFDNHAERGGPFMDGFWDSNYPDTYQNDINHGTTKDGSAAISFSNGTEIFEISHPLCSQDINHDFCINRNNVSLHYELTFGVEDSFDSLFYEGYFGGMQDFNVLLGLEMGLCCFNLEEIIPPADFILGPFGRLDSGERDKFLANITAFERDKLLNNPDAKDVANFLKSLSPDDRKLFLDVLSSSELVETIETLEPPYNVKLLEKINEADRARLLEKINEADRARLFGNPTDVHTANFLKNSTQNSQ